MLERMKLELTATVTKPLDRRPVQPATTPAAYYLHIGDGAGGWSVSKYGGPGPTFAWDDTNTLAPATYFNRGLYDDEDPSAAPFTAGFGNGVLAFDGEVVIAIKGDHWGVFPDGSPYPAGDRLYPLRYATNGSARVLIDAIDPRLSEAETFYYANYPLGHTGMPMRRQKTRFDP